VRIGKFLGVKRGRGNLREPSRGVTTDLGTWGDHNKEEELAIGSNAKKSERLKRQKGGQLIECKN